MSSGKQEKRKMRLRSKSYFYKYFISFLIMLIVPMLTMVLVFVHTQKLVKEQIQIASRNTLNQFFERIDDTMKEGYEICITVANDEKCKQYPIHAKKRPGKTTYYVWEIMKVLNNFISEKYYDIFVYYPIDDRIISGEHASLTLDAYYNIHYGETEKGFRDEFYKIVKMTSGKPMLCSMNGNGTDSFLCIAMNQKNSSNKNNTYTVVVVLHPNYVTEVLKSVESREQNGISMIFGEEKEMVFLSDDTALHYGLEGYKESDVAFEDVIEDETYIIEVRDSGILNACYLYATPYGYFWKKLFSLYVVCGVGAFLSIGIGILVAWRETEKVYRPVEQILARLQINGLDAYDDSTNTEFEFIESLFDREIKEKLEMNIELRRDTAMKRNHFIYSALSGNVEVKGESDDVFCENGIELCSDSFYVIVMGIEKKGMIEDSLRFFVISNVYEELINRVHVGYVVALPEDKCAILVNVNEGIEEDGKFSFLEEGMVFLKQHFGITTSFGIGSLREGLLGIKESFEEACFALKYKYLLGKESIIEYCQVAEREFKYVPTSESKLLFRINDYLYGDVAGTLAPQLLTEVMRDYGISKDASLETVECFKFETVSALNRVMIQGGYWSEEGKCRVKNLLNESSLEGFIEKLEALLQELYQKQKDKEVDKGVCEQAFEYIETHYTEAQLSLAGLGEMLDIAPSYLSKLFKEKYQISIPDYISQTRINNAKLQLRNTSHNIRDIAETNGFLSSSVFCKTFKKLEGITPGAYRDLYDKGRH